jgi:hypothetical protein
MLAPAAVSEALTAPLLAFSGHSEGDKVAWRQEGLLIAAAAGNRPTLQPNGGVPSRLLGAAEQAKT